MARILCPNNKGHSVCVPIGCNKRPNLWPLAYFIKVSMALCKRILPSADLRCHQGIYPYFRPFSNLNMCHQSDSDIKKSISSHFTFGQTFTGEEGKPENIRRYGWKYIDAMMLWSIVWGYMGSWNWVSQTKQYSWAVMHNSPLMHTSKTVR